MYSKLKRINKTNFAASCWLLISPYWWRTVTQTSRSLRQIKAFWGVILSQLASSSWCSEGPRCLHLQGKAVQGICLPDPEGNTLWSLKRLRTARLTTQLSHHVIQKSPSKAAGRTSDSLHLLWIKILWFSSSAAIRRWADTFCLHCNIFIYIRYIWIKPVLCSRTVSLFQHTSPWTHRCLQCSHSAHRNGRVFRRSVRTACGYWILNRGEKFIQLKFTDKCKPFVAISVLMWVQ